MLFFNHCSVSHNVARDVTLAVSAVYKLCRQTEEPENAKAGGLKLVEV